MTDRYFVHCPDSNPLNHQTPPVRPDSNLVSQQTNPVLHQTPPVLPDSNPVSHRSTASNQTPIRPAPKLVAPGVVLSKYDRLRGTSKMGELAAKLAREAFFGEDVMAKSTVCGTQGMIPLDPGKVAQLREVILSLFSQYACSPHFFAPIWKKCQDSINHAVGRDHDLSPHVRNLVLLYIHALQLLPYFA